MSTRDQLPIALAVVGLVPAVYAAPCSHRASTAAALGLVAVVAAVTRSEVAAVVGVAAVAAFAVLYRHQDRGGLWQH